MDKHFVLKMVKKKFFPKCDIKMKMTAWLIRLFSLTEKNPKLLKFKT